MGLSWWSQTNLAWFSVLKISMAQYFFRMGFLVVLVSSGAGLRGAAGDGCSPAVAGLTLAVGAAPLRAACVGGGFPVARLTVAADAAPLGGRWWWRRLASC